MGREKAMPALRKESLRANVVVVKVKVVVALPSRRRDVASEAMERSLAGGIFFCAGEKS